MMIRYVIIKFASLEFAASYDVFRCYINRIIEITYNR